MFVAKVIFNNSLKTSTINPLSVILIHRCISSFTCFISVGIYAHADRVEVQVSCAIGVAHPLLVNVETLGTAKISDDHIAGLISDHFDLRPGAIIRDLDLRRPIYRQTTNYGHFGKPDVPWEA